MSFWGGVLSSLAAAMLVATAFQLALRWLTPSFALTSGAKALSGGPVFVSVMLLAAWMTYPRNDFHYAVSTGAGILLGQGIWLVRRHRNK